METASGRGNRVLPHSADVILEAWGPDVVACCEEAVASLVELHAEGSDAVLTGGCIAFVDLGTGVAAGTGAAAAPVGSSALIEDVSEECRSGTGTCTRNAGKPDGVGAAPPELPGGRAARYHAAGRLLRARREARCPTQFNHRE